jgi:hypothetical protein
LWFWVTILVIVALACNLSTESEPARESIDSSQEVALPQAGDETAPEMEEWAPPPPAGELVECDDLSADFVTELDVRQTPNLEEPETRAPFQDPVFGTCLIRVTNRREDISPTDESLGLKNEYSRVQSFNADGSRFIIRGTEATWYLYDGYSLQPLAELPLEIDPRWDARDPNRLYFSDETSLMLYDIESGEISTVHDFANDFPGQTVTTVWSRYEGSPSADGRYWGFMVHDANWDVFGFLVYDLFEDRVISRHEIPPNSDIDTVTISTLGNYFLGYFPHCERGQLGTMEEPCGLMAYDQDFQEARSLLRIIGHSDTVLDEQGREVLVFQDIDTDYISMVVLAIGKVKVGIQLTIPGWMTRSLRSSLRIGGEW